MNRSVITGIAALAMMFALAISSVDTTSTAQAGCKGLFGGLFKKHCGGAVCGGEVVACCGEEVVVDCGGCGGLFKKRHCGGLLRKGCTGGGLFARLKARHAACSAPVTCCEPAPVPCAPCGDCGTVVEPCSDCGTVVEPAAESHSDAPAAEGTEEAPPAA